MKFKIDVLFLSKTGEVLYLIHSMDKNSISPRIYGCKQVLELNGGMIEKYGINIGDVLAIE